MNFNEDTRVKIPTILHLTRMGYQYLSLKEQNWDRNTNIFPDIFFESVSKINPTIQHGDIPRLLERLRKPKSITIFTMPKTLTAKRPNFQQ